MTKDMGKAVLTEQAVPIAQVLANAPTADSIRNIRGVRRNMIRALRLAFPCALIVGLWHLADGADVFARLSAVDPLWILAAFACANIQTVLSAVRWRLVAAQLGLPISARFALQEYYVSQLVNQTVPGGIVGDAARAMRSRHGTGLLRAAQAVVIERTAGQIALGVVMLAGFSVALGTPEGFDWPEASSRMLIAAIGGIAIFLVVLRITASRVAALGKMQGLLRQTLTAPGMWQRHVVLGALIVACNLAIFAFCAAATGTHLPAEAIATLIPLVLLAMLLPLTIGGWGWREGAAAALFPVAGASASAGLAASVSFGAILFASSLPGTLWILSEARRNDASRPAPQEQRVQGPKDA